MKYLKYFENNKYDPNIIKDFGDKILNLTKEFFINEDVPPIHMNLFKPKLYRRDFEDEYYIEIGFKGNNGITKFIFFKVFKYINNNIEIFFETNYVGMDAWKITELFKEYFVGMTKPLSFDYDSDVEFNLHYDKFEKLVSSLSVDNYKIKMDTNKYNL